MGASPSLPPPSYHANASASSSLVFVVSPAVTQTTIWAGPWTLLESVPRLGHPRRREAAGGAVSPALPSPCPAVPEPVASPLPSRWRVPAGRDRPFHPHVLYPTISGARTAGDKVPPGGGGIVSVSRSASGSHNSLAPPSLCLILLRTHAALGISVGRQLGLRPARPPGPADGYGVFPSILEQGQTGYSRLSLPWHFSLGSYLGITHS